MSIDDSVNEMQATFVARSIAPLQAVGHNRPKIHSSFRLEYQVFPACQPFLPSSPIATVRSPAPARKPRRLIILPEPCGWSARRSAGAGGALPLRHVLPQQQNGEKHGCSCFPPAGRMEMVA